ncbi:Hsp33 family molecular chaperone HslO [Sphingomonas sp. NBWT7]|uniref:Hsp33 family molecular chaperone HslO n=1 Tax=Sphingomonas sp. NBWT7 TaxID=2596913 RepID=UPI00162A1349|nr:Hsp33 family molecular chaperone HslO [Sphingomonas sp. NBWT7]QNE31705.1 Hsp33 family molecular chaperone HslO [Sphingomonas sp. NBWT7]
MHATTRDIDRAIGFAIPQHHARGRIVRLGPVLDQILAAHAYPPAIEALLAEALTLTALVGSTLKDADGQLTMQTQSDQGVVRLLVCDYRGGELRGYVQYDADRLADAPSDPTLFALFGKAYLAITLNLAASGERYQGIVPLDGDRLADAVQSYFAQSEQIPTHVRVGFAKDAGGCIAGGLLLQHLPEGEEGRERLHTKLDHPEWEHVATLGATMGTDELADPALSLETLVWRLFNEEENVRVLASTAMVKGCRCSIDHIRSVLAKFPADERRAMADENGVIGVDCAFCSTVFPIGVDDLTESESIDDTHV